MVKKLLRRIGGKWYSLSEIKELKKKHKLKELRRNARANLPDTKFLDKISKESGYAGIRMGKLW